MKYVLGIMIVLALWAFDHAMKQDAKRLCSNDRTAYSGCSDQF